MPPKTNEEYMREIRNIQPAHPLVYERIEQILTEKDQELQKAHHNWLRDEIVKLEGVKMANEHSSECLHNEAPEYCDCDNYIKWNKALQTIIDRYQEELDQPTV